MSDELQLVSACLEGDQNAWEQFTDRYRPCVLEAALRFTRDPDTAEEIAGSIWADLFLKHKLALYAGRGSLDGWLRTLVAQAYVDRYRRERRFVSLDESAAEAAQAGGFELAGVDERLAPALDRALAELSTERRLILAAHYLDERPFAEIGRMLGIHESSVSRQAKKALDTVRKRTAHYLRLSGMSMSEAEDAMGAEIEQIALDVRKRLQLVKNTP